MKTLSLIVMIVLLGVFAQAQQTEPATPTAPKPFTGFSIATEKVVKNAPFSAEAVSESVQTLADGNRIVNKSTSKLYRNSEGRFRRETENGSGGFFGSSYTYGPGVTILDPIMGQKYLLDSKLFTATASAFKAMPGFEVKTNMSDEQKKAIEEKLKDLKEKADTTDAQKAVIIEKLKGELQAMTPMAPMAPLAGMNGQPFNGTVSIAGGGNVGVFAPEARMKFESKTEQLGVQNFEGVDAEGTRTTTTIPADAIGNERPIEIVYERWYSKELDLVVMSKHSDPRTGEQTYKLTNLVRAEPDSSLFALPMGYKVRAAPAAGAYMVSPAVTVDAVAIPKVAVAPITPTPAPKAKPQ